MKRCSNFLSGHLHEHAQNFAILQGRLIVFLAVLRKLLFSGVKSFSIQLKAEDNPGLLIG